MKNSAALKNSLGFTLILTLCTFIILFSGTVKQGVFSGMQTAVNTVIPSMFPFMCLGAIAVNCFGEIPMPMFLKKAYCALFRLPPVTAKTVIMGLIGGYPTGCMMTSEQLSLQQIDKHEAKRLALFTINCGPAFSILAVGEEMCASKLTGVLLFISASCATLILGIVLARFDKSDISGENSQVKKSQSSFASKFTESIENSAVTCLKICAWISAFSAVLSTIDSLVENDAACNIIGAVAEVTNGCLQNSSSPIILAAIIGWGGICVHAQISRFAIDAGVHIYEILLTRALVAGLSALIMWVLILIFPQVKSAAAINGYTVIPTHSGIGMTVALTVLIIIFVLDRKCSFGFNKNR